MAGTVVVTAATGSLGRRVCARIAADPAVTRVIAIDRPGVPAAAEAVPAAGVPAAAVTHHRIELVDPELERLCEGADAIVHLGAGAPLTSPEVTLDGTGSSGDVEGTRALLAVAADAGVRTLVVLSSAMVYGAWPNNPVPLTEAAPLRPAAELPFAVEKAEIERLAAAWRAEQAGAGAEINGVRVAILRPAISVGPESETWLGRSPWSNAGLTVHEAEPPVQFVHLDDVATAVDIARRQRLDGAFNVAPDGWLTGRARRDLTGPTAQVKLPAGVAERVASFRWKFGLTGTPPSVLPYTMYSWVVANDRLKATGWLPRHTNEEAFVEADPGGALSTMTPARRQQLSLAALGAVVAGVVVAGLGALRAARRRTH